jgi:Protein of unknown function (DUF3592)
MMKYVLTWLVLAAVFVIVIGGANWPGLHRMTVRGVSGQATVIELHPEFHNTVRYEYHVAGQTFQGQMQSWKPNPDLQQLSVGQPLVIYYDPEYPEKSVLGNPKPMLENETISVMLAATISPTFIVLAWSWRSSRKYANQRVNTQAV